MIISRVCAAMSVRKVHPFQLRGWRGNIPMGLNPPVGLLSVATMNDLWAHGMSPGASAAQSFSPSASSDNSRKWWGWDHQ